MKWLALAVLLVFLSKDARATCPAGTRTTPNDADPMARIDTPSITMTLADANTACASTATPYVCGFVYLYYPPNGGDFQTYAGCSIRCCASPGDGKPAYVYVNPYQDPTLAQVVVMFAPGTLLTSFVFQAGSPAGQAPPVFIWGADQYGTQLFLFKSHTQTDYTAAISQSALRSSPLRT